MGREVRRYRVTFTVYDGPRYDIRQKEIVSLRSVGEFIKKVVEDPLMEFRSIKAVTYGDLDDQEKQMLVFFSDGAIEKI